MKYELLGEDWGQGVGADYFVRINQQPSVRMAERMYIPGLDSEDSFEERTLVLVGVTNIDDSPTTLGGTNDLGVTSIDEFPGRMYIPGLDSDDSFKERTQAYVGVGVTNINDSLTTQGETENWRAINLVEVPTVPEDSTPTWRMVKKVTYWWSLILTPALRR